MGPISVVVRVSDKLMHYKSGTFVDDGTCAPNRLHAILAVGYQPGYWIIKNRFGSSLLTLSFYRLLIINFISFINCLARLLTKQKDDKPVPLAQWFECPLRKREVVGSIPGRDIPKTLKWHQWLPCLALSITRQALASVHPKYCIINIACLAKYEKKSFRMN